MYKIRSCKKTNYGFTYLESMIVIVLVGAITAYTVARYSDISEKGRATEAIANMCAIRNAEVLYKLKYGVYTDSNDVITALNLPIWSNYDANYHYWFYSVGKDSSDATRVAIGATRTSKNAPTGKAGKYLQCWFYEDGRREWVSNYTDVNPTETY